MAKTIALTEPTTVDAAPVRWVRVASVMSLIAVLVLPFDANVIGQSPADATISLSDDAASDSQFDAIRSDLITAITQGASPAEIQRLISRRKRIDELLENRLRSNRDELAEIERAEFDPQTLPRREELRRQQSVLWLSRVELISLVTEMFAERSPDGVAMAEQSIQMIRDAIASFPNDGVVRLELMRLLAEAQLRAGHAEAAVRTMALSARAAADSESASETPANEKAPNPELVVNTPDELAFVIRVDLAKQNWEAAAEKLDLFYGAEPAKSPINTAMDLVRLQYLLMRPPRDTALVEVGQWLDAIERRSGATTRRAAETLLARYREFRNPTASQTGKQQSPVDPRVLRADARYYLRVDQPLPAAVTFARAAIEDSDPDRSIDSAIRSVAILNDIDKRPAAVQLLRQTAIRHEQHEYASMLMLQAASLRSETDASETPPGVPTADELLHELIEKWPVSSAAVAARNALIDSAIAREDWIHAAVLATHPPAEHWSDATATRCRDLWQRAIVNPDQIATACHWDDRKCQETAADSLAKRLSRMREAFATSASHPLAMQTLYACTILLDSAAAGTPGGQRLTVAAKETSDPFLASVAALRLGEPHQTTAPDGRYAAAKDLRDTVVWRLHQDVLENPVLHRPIAAYLLTMTRDDEVTPRLRISWLMWNEQVEQGMQELRKQLATADHPGDLLAAAASALADSSRNRDRKQAAILWEELASGIPTSHRSHHQAKVESIVCRGRSGDLEGAKAAAEWMLLSNPPNDQELLDRLREWI
ncbi:hypothetical protein [Aporhodopirellula aestuarii]|uniref:Uncharacterized protein n=1 Tax=Aporhodopirellula aestuarii TaxID=2950107 RepID=A0ABT0U4P2_9BACT|nr:hypothetical protein [Aporhodopirellula aestuarii]MCM2371848.1 hypothetical protein [Aporhodopirellula aestuarii]